MMQTVNAPFKPGQWFIWPVRHSLGYSIEVGIGNSQKPSSRRVSLPRETVFEYTELVYLLTTEELEVNCSEMQTRSSNTCSTEL
jgi:hypothetical protein